MNNKKVQNLCIILLVIVLFMYLVIFINSIINKNSKVGFFSTKFYIMSSDCEEAGVKSGDLVFAKTVATEDIQTNDCIIFKRNDELIIKKIKSTDKTNGNTNFYIQSDSLISNEKLDNVEIVGKVEKSIKGIGNIALFVQSPLGTINIVVIILCIFIIIKKISNTKENNGDANDKKE